MNKEIEEFEKWWDSEWETLDAPYSNQSSMYYAWLAWNAGRKAEREWVGLTYEEVMQLVKKWHGSITLASAIEAKLKEKNDF